MKLGVSPELSHSDGTPASRGCADPKMDNLNIDEELAKRRAEVVEWIDGLFPDLVVDIDASEEGLRARLLDGAVLFRILNRFRLFGSEVIGNGSRVSTEKRFDCIIRFISAVEQMGLPGFKLSDFEQGPMTAVIYCLWCLKNHLCCNFGEENTKSPLNHVVEARRRSKPMEIKRVKSLKFFRENSYYSAEKSADSAEDGQNSLVDLRLKHLLQASPVFSEPSTPHSDRNGHKFHEVFQLKQGRYSQLPAAKISEMLKSNSLDNAPTQSLLSVIHGILEESIERGNGEIPFRVACLLKKVIQEIERRIAAQADHIRNQNNLIKAREDKFQSRIRVLETLANASNEEAQMVMNQLDQLKAEKSKTEEKKIHSEDIIRIIKDKDKRDKVVSELKQTLETMKRSYQEQLQQMERNANDSELELKQRLKEAECLLSESRERREQIEAEISSKYQNWSKKVDIFQSFIALLLQSVQGLRESYNSTKHKFVDTEKRWSEEFTNLGEKMKMLTDAADSYHEVLAENRKLYNEVQELKGNIRVYCRIRPFLSEENKRQTSVENIGENGELVLVNPSKQGKDGKRIFNYNKVFGPSATQEEVFLDTRPLIRSVIDGYNVCIFAYGQTGSGKTYTMTGPDGGSEKDWGVNYRALNDLFNISRSKSGTFRHEVSVQMVEIYNEQVRDLLPNHGSQQRLGIMATTQPNGLAVPDATIHPVETTSDVLELMKIGHLNRAVCSTALNERSSRSHSILTVHVQGTDLKSETTLRGSLHLVDLAGSERVDRAEVVGDRLKEAQHINKSLSALGDVIFALSQKSSHVPYRNSKLTQVLQSSLGGHAKTLMFVQINPDVGSYSETLSTLKFAERVSGVELGAARSQKEGKEVRDLIEQVASLKDTLARKEEEIEQLKQVKILRSQSPDAKIERHSKGLLKQNSSPPGGISSLGATVQLKQKILGRKPVNKSKTAKNHENNSENGYHSESSSQKSAEEDKYRRQGFSLPTVQKLVRSSSADVELLDIHDGYAEERLSDISDSVPSSMVADTDGSRNCAVEFSLFTEQKKPSETPKEIKIPARIPKPPLKTIGQDTVSKPKINDALKPASKYKSKTAKSHENNSENGYHSESSSQKSAEEDKYRRQGFSLPTVQKLVRSSSADVELLDIHDGDAEERLSDISDSVPSSMVADTDGSRNCAVEFSLFTEQKKPSETPKEIKIPARIPKPPLKTIGQDTVFKPKINDALKPASKYKSKTAKSHENNSENGYHSESSSQKSAEEDKYRRQGFSLPTVQKLVRSSSADVELLDIHDGDAERLSDISDSVPSSIVADTDGSRNCAVEFSLFTEQKKPSETPKEIKIPARIPKPPLKTIGQDTVSKPKINDALKPANSRKGTNHVRTPSPARATKRWQ